MRKWILAILLVLASPSVLAASERVADVLKDLQTHGYTSPATAAARLQAAEDAGDAHAPVEQRRRYYAELLGLALAGRDAPLLQGSLDGLQKMAKQERCTSCRAMWLIGKAQEATMQRQLKQAKDYLAQATPLVADDDDPLQLQLANTQIRIDHLQGDLSLAVRKSIAALDLAERSNDNATYIHLLANLSGLYAALGDLDRATSVAERAAAQAQQLGFTAALAAIRVNQSYIYSRGHHYDQQLQALQQALALEKGVAGLAFMEVITRANLSEYYLNQGNYPAALVQARETAKLAHARNDPYSEAIATGNIGTAEAHMGHTDAALVSLHKALDLARQSGQLQTEVAINTELVQALESAGRYREALQATQALEGVNRKLTQQERDRAVLELQAKYNDERKNREIERLSTQARLKEAKAAAQRWQQRLWTVLAVVALLATALMVFWLARARRANRRLADDVANLAEQSSLDELTGVFNRRHFAVLMEPYDHESTPQAGLVMLDIDHFKQINDNYGHDIGDTVLKEVVRRLRSLGRANDYIVRWGGEEFVVVLPDASPQSLPLLVQRMLNVVARWPFQVGQHSIQVSISAGCVAHPLEPDCPWEQALRLADAAMYRAKRNGRNRATCVTRVNRPLSELAETDLAAAMQSGAIEMTEIAGPLRPALERRV